MGLETCKNCRCTIGELEQAFVHEGHVVCKKCYEKLKNQQQLSPSSVKNTTTGDEEKVVWAAHPKMFRGHPLLFIISVGLIFAYGLGAVILFFWWLDYHFTVYRITNKRIERKEDILSRHINEVRHCDIRNIQVHQGILQRICRAGNIGLSTAGQSGIEVFLRCVKHPHSMTGKVRSYQG